MEDSEFVQPAEGADVFDERQLQLIKSLPTTAYLVLGVLVVEDGELSAVDLKTRADFTLGMFYWAPAVSHIRRELARLLELGMVTEREVRTGRVRSTLRYQSTSRGERLLQRWSAALPETEPVVVKHPVLLRIWLASSDEPTQLLEALDRHIKSVRYRLDELHWGRRRAEDLGLDRRKDPHTRNAMAVQNYLFRSLYSEILNCEQLRDELARGTSQDPISRVNRQPGALHPRYREPSSGENERE